AVLREARLGDVEIAEDFDAREQRTVELARIGEDFAEVAIDAETDPAGGLLRLNVDVRRALAHREVQDLVEDLDERIVLCERRQLVAGDLGLVEQARTLEFAETFLQ